MLAAVASIFATAEVALGQTVADSAKKWGLLGTWSVDCSKPASGSNSYLTYTAREGRVYHEREFGDRRDANAVLLAKITNDNSIELLIRFEGLSQTRQFVMMKGSDGRIRAKWNRNVDTGEYSIKDGKLVGSGAESVWQKRCPVKR
jgi:hypothetical protein